MPYLSDTYSAQKLNKPKIGRPHGSKGKVSESIRWGFVEAYRQLGGVDGLVKWGKAKPDLFYPMLTKLLPAELAESGAGQSIRVIVYGKELGNNPTCLDVTPQGVVGQAGEGKAEAGEVDEQA